MGENPQILSKVRKPHGFKKLGKRLIMAAPLTTSIVNSEFRASQSESQPTSRMLRNVDCRIEIYSQRGVPTNSLFAIRHPICITVSFARTLIQSCHSKHLRLMFVRENQSSSTHHLSREYFRQKPAQSHHVFVETVLQDFLWPRSEQWEHDTDLNFEIRRWARMRQLTSITHTRMDTWPKCIIECKFL